LVVFDTAGPPGGAPYWIIELGPIVDGLYDWAIVSDNLSAFLFVLARDVERFYALYNDEVLKQLVTLGFTGIKAPIQTYQGSNCTYNANFLAKENGGK